MKSNSSKKHSWTHWAGNGLGAVLILSGLIWTCQKSVFPRIVSASDNTVHNGSVSALSRLAPSRAEARPVSALEQPGTSFDMLPVPSEIDMLPAAGEPFPNPGEMPNTLPLYPEPAASVPLTAQAPDPSVGGAPMSNIPAAPAAVPPAALPQAPAQTIATPPVTAATAPITAPAAPPAIPALPQAPAAPPAAAPQTAAPAEMPAPAPAEIAAPQGPVAPGQLPEDPLASYPDAGIPRSELNTSANFPGTADTSPRLEYVASLLSRSMPATSARPGDSTLEGLQKAELSIEKVLPEEVQIGCEETFKVIVRNVGKAIAKNVTLWDQVPTGTTLVATTPPIEPTQEGELIWTGFDLAPEEEQVFEYRLIPQSEGAIGSVASVSFQTEASGKTSCTRPMLQLHVEAPDQVLVGDSLRFEIEISNPGTGTARDVVLREEVPEGLIHKSGKKLDNAIGSIEPGETKHIALTLQAQTAGNIINHMSVSGHGQLSAEADTPVTVQAPELALEIQGAKVRYLERETTYTLKVWNPGTAMAKNIRLTAQLPPQMKFVRTNNEGVYQESSHSVYWELIELPDNVAPGDIELVLLPTEAGSGRINFHGEGEMNLAADTSCEVSIEGMAALSYTVASLSDPVEVGQDAVYEIRLSNRGTKDSSNITISVVLPESMEVVAVEGPTSFSASGSSGQFGTLSRIAAKDEAVYRLTTRCAAPGDHRIKVQVASDEMEPLVKEESVRIYGSN